MKFIVFNGFLLNVNEIAYSKVYGDFFQVVLISEETTVEIPKDSDQTIHDLYNAIKYGINS